MGMLTWAVIMKLAATPSCTYPGMVPEFWPAVMGQESSHHSLAIHDDTSDKAYYPDNADSAVAIATTLMGRGHSVGVGLSQLTARSEGQFYNKFGITVKQAFDACANMRAGAQHYVKASLSIYNSGSPTRSLRYAEKVTARITNASNVTPVIVVAKSARQVKECIRDPKGRRVSSACHVNKSDRRNK